MEVGRKAGKENLGQGLVGPMRRHKPAAARRAASARAPKDRYCTAHRLLQLLPRKLCAWRLGSPPGPGYRAGPARAEPSRFPFTESIMSMSDRDGFIWYDGKLVPWRDATTHVLTHSLHYGLAVFEGVRAYNTDIGTAIFKLKEHTNRLFNSAHIYQMAIPYDRDAINAAQCEVVRANQLESCYIRPLVFYGSEKMGVSPKGAQVHVAIAAWPWGAYLGEEALKQGIRVKVSSYARQHVNVTMPRAKVASTYANSIIANAEALDHGYDEAILLDTEGFVAEGSGENIFIVKDGVLCEPEIASALTGITRATIHTLAADLGIPLVTKRLTRDDLYIADEAFFSGTAAEVTPIREVDRRVIGQGSRGPITAKLQQAFFDAVNGRNPKYRHWLTKV
jgi:branched-chain amino acid aminotransferase